MVVVCCLIYFLLQLPTYVPLLFRMCVEMIHCPLISDAWIGRQPQAAMASQEGAPTLASKRYIRGEKPSASWRISERHLPGNVPGLHLLRQNSLQAFLCSYDTLVRIVSFAIANHLIGEKAPKRIKLGLANANGICRCFQLVKNPAQICLI